MLICSYYFTVKTLQVGTLVSGHVNYGPLDKTLFEFSSV